MRVLFSPLRSAFVAVLGPCVRFARGIPANSFEPQYLNLVRKVLREGQLQENRTSLRAISLHGAFVRFDISESFPALTTKKLAFKSAIGELCAFLRAKTSAADLRALGCKVWDQNANDNDQWLANPWRRGADDIGQVYGAMWRKWPAFKQLNMGPIEKSLDGPSSQREQLDHAMSSGFAIVDDYTDDHGDHILVLHKEVDQLRACLDTLIANPTDRRMVFTGWNPAVLDQISLPACHHTYTFSANVAKKELSLQVNMRSTDIGLGLPFNSATASALLTLVARLTGFTPKWVSISMADAHIYENQVEMLQEQLRRFPKKLPRLVLSSRIPSYAETGRFEPAWLDHVNPGDFELEGYEHHAALSAAMAV